MDEIPQHETAPEAPPSAAVAALDRFLEEAAETLARLGLGDLPRAPAKRPKLISAPQTPSSLTGPGRGDH